jgi:hypothetical protein
MTVTAAAVIAAAQERYGEQPLDAERLGRDLAQARQEGALAFHVYETP